MPSATITSKGQITIPQEICKTLGLEAGDKVTFRLNENGIVEMQPETLDLMSLCGSLKPRVRGVTLEDMEQAIADGATQK
jgi:AbrB family looped-hinge helix DNA binding protein